eukprot:9700415-Karenia_brevis.AAC.1
MSIVDPIICARCWKGWSLGGTCGPIVDHPVPLPLVQYALPHSAYPALLCLASLGMASAMACASLAPYSGLGCP